LGLPVLTGLSGKRKTFCIILIFFIFTSTIVIPTSGASESGLIRSTESNDDVHRKSRAPNEDTEPNSDFASSSIVQYDASGTTHIFDSNVGGTGDTSDYWRLDCDRGNPTGSGSTNPDKIRIILSFNETNQGSNGVYMNIYDAEYHRLGQSVVARELEPVIMLLIAQVNSYFYIQIQSNPPTDNFNYIMTIINETLPINGEFHDDEQFINATPLNLTKGGTLNGLPQYLDKSYDFADFYKFDAVKNQKIDINLQPSRNAQDDFDMFLFKTPTAGAWITSSQKIQQNERIMYYSPENSTYYLRVAVKNICDPNLENSGHYKLTFSGNLPPKWNESFPVQYTMDEDGPDLIIPIPNAYYEENLGDDIFIEVFDPNKGIDGAWLNTYDFSSISLQNITINSQADPVTNLRIKAKPNKFGTDIIKVRATDNLKENYTYRNLKIVIKPKNDAPILNGTNNWKINSALTPSNNGDKITGQEGSLFECWVTAYEPYDPFDSITFSDNSDIFDIDPKTGKISFMATYNYTGEHTIKITATDNGTPQLNTTRDFLFVVESSDNFPEVELLTPIDNRIVTTLNPQFKWQQVNEDFDETSIKYEFFLSTNENLVKTGHSTALKAKLTDTTILTLNESLEDDSTYYWTVVPNDGLHLGECRSGVFTFQTDTKIERPSVELESPLNEQLLNTDSVTLSWDLLYVGNDKISYDLYFGVSLEELTDPLREPLATITQKSYEIKNLYFERTYFWKVRPHTDKVMGDDSEILSFYLTKNIPNINLLTPVDNSIVLPQNSITLTWEINYTQPGKINCVLFWGTTPTFDDVKGFNLGNNKSYTLKNLKMDTYYWKVIPYLDTQLGFESEIWSFSIQNVLVPEVVLLEPINTTLYASGDTILVTLSWRVEYDGGFDPNDIWYEVFLDNSTSIMGGMKKENLGYYFQSIYMLILPFEENKTYYWYVIPHLHTDYSTITGICRQGVVQFKFGEPEKFYGIDVEITTEEISISSGTQKIVHVIIKNLGNQPATVIISAESDHPEDIISKVAVTKIVILPGEEKNITLSILVLENVGHRNSNVTVKAVVEESTVVSDLDTISLNINPDQDDKTSENGDGEGAFSLNTALGYAFIFIIILIFSIISLFLYSKIKRHRLLENQRREAIFNHIKTNPGDHFRSIMNELNLEVGTLSYHVNKLESEGLIKSRQDGMYRRFYTIDARIDGKLILSELQERILNFIKTNPGISGSNIANEFGMDRKIITYHVGVLQKIGFVYTEPSGREVLCYSTSGV
jgi:predicted transcriptional regulator